MKTIKIIALLTITILFSCKSKIAKEDDQHEVLPANTVELNNDQYKIAGIALGALEERILSNTIKVSGVITFPPQNMVSVCASMGGYVKKSTLVEGSPVRKGQILATIENAEFIDLQQTYLESKNQLEYLDSDFKRQKELYKENVSSAKSYQQSLAEYKNLKVKIAALEQKLAMIGINTHKLREDKITREIEIISPISGFLKTTHAAIGKYINPTDVLFEIINNQDATLELTLFEKDITKVSNGQKLDFVLSNNPEITQTATVFQIGKAINEDKTVKVYAKINSKTSGLVAGMFVNAFIQTENNQTDALPKDAIVSFDDKKYIFIYKGKRNEGQKVVNDFEQVEVKTGVSNNGYTEVILPEHIEKKMVKIVTKGAYSLLSAMKNAGEMSC